MLRYRFKEQKISRYYFLLLFFLLGSILLPGPAEAARRKVIFQLSNFRHWAEIEYEYNGKSYSNDGSADRYSQQHELSETYHFDIDYSILDRDLANGRLSIDFGLDQIYEDESGGSGRNDGSAGFIGEYLFDMIAFERRFYPISLMSSLTQERISAPFTESYDSIRQTLSVAAALRNSFLPVGCSYRYDTTETSGLSSDRSQETEELSLNAHSTIGDFSETGLDAKTSSIRTDFSDSSQASTRTDTDKLELRNLLRWGSLGKKNFLDSRYYFVDDTGISVRQSQTWDEDLELQLGKALTTGFSYSYRNTESPTQQQQQRRGDTWIEHRLFDSLTTRIDYSVNRTDYLSGEEQSWQYRANISYSKKLLRESHLNLTYTYRYGANDSNLVDQQLTVTDEAFPVNVFLSGFLDQFDIIPATIVVYSADRSIIYTSGTEYLINIIGRRTELQIIGGGIIPGDVLSIDYLYRVNNSLEYSTTGNLLSASLGLFGQRYRLYGSLSITDHDLIAGIADVSPLTQQTYAQIGLEGNFDSVSFGTSYSYQDSTLSTDNTAEAFVSYLLRKNRSHLNLRLTERYTTTQQNEGNIGAAEDVQKRNTLSFNADYRRQLRCNLTLNLRGHVIDIRGQSRDQDDIFLGMILESRWYKFTAQLSADVSWQIYEDSSSREDSVSFKIRRYF